MYGKYIYLIAFCTIFSFNHKCSVDAVPFFKCKEHNIRLLQILSFVCNNTHPDLQLRDACYGCFLRSASLPAGPPQLIGISQCSSLYFFNTTYQICGQGLAASLVGIKPVNPIEAITCATGYCEYIRCMRRINALLLINSCFTINLVNRDFNLIQDRISFYSNTTACILARTRCSEINPITADIQRQRGTFYPPGITNAVGTAGYYHHNAIQIGRNGDIKIIGLPSAWVLGNTFCNNNISLDQSPYGNTCPF